MAFMVVRADVAGIHRNVVGDRRTGYDAFLEPEYLGEWRALKVRTLVSNFWPSLLECTTSPMSKWRKSTARGGVADPVIGLPQRLGPQEVIGRGDEGVVADVGYLARPGDAHVGAPGDETGNIEFDSAEIFDARRYFIRILG